MAYTQPSPGDVHVNRPLTNMSIAFMQGADGFVASRAFPRIPVMNQSNSYYVYPIETFFRSEMEERAPGDPPVISTHKLSHDTYDCRVWAEATPVTDEERANVDRVIRLDRAATRRLTASGMIRFEKRWTDLAFKDGTWAFREDGVNSGETAAGSFSPRDFGNNQVKKWNATGVDPILRIDEAKDRMREWTGKEPNTLVLGSTTYRVLRHHDEVIGRLNAGQTPGGPAMANRQRLAELLEIPNIMVMKAIRETTNEGVTDSSRSFIGPQSDALLMYSAEAPGMEEASAGYTFAWQGFLGMEEEGMRIRRYRKSDRLSDFVAIDMAWDFKVTSDVLGYHFNDIV
ncbi:MAG: hypothetical protein OXG79_12505 [Chloroflexi bacterium]|nr:hypothetical protein [Chloroflexota bacterium]